MVIATHNSRGWPESESFLIYPRKQTQAEKTAEVVVEKIRTDRSLMQGEGPDKMPLETRPEHTAKALGKGGDWSGRSRCQKPKE